MSVVTASSSVLDAGSSPAISTNLTMKTHLSRVILWVDGFSFSPCIPRVSDVLISLRNLSPATRFSPFFRRSFSAWGGILCFFPTGTGASGYRYSCSIEPATTWGRLYQLPAGFPALEVPESSVLATGTADPLADTRTQNAIQLPENAMTRPKGDWDLGHGELITFANPGFDLPPIDRLEAFDLNGRCVYTRVLVGAECPDRFFSCWTYRRRNHIFRDSVHLSRGYWEIRNLAKLG